jgi:hypothetical protein
VLQPSISDMPKSKTQSQLERLTGQLHLFPTGDFVYDRDFHYVGPMPDKWVNGWKEIAEDLRGNKYTRRARRMPTSSTA